MKKLNYNIAENKKLNLPHFGLTLFILFLLSLILFFTGINKVMKTNSTLREKLNLKKHFVDEQKKISDQEDLFTSRISEIKKGWNRRVLFANRTIISKEFSFIDRLDFFEKILPDMVQINELTVDSGKKGEIRLTVSSYSTEKLYSFYKKLIKYNLAISGENERDGIFIARLKINYKNEKK